MRAGFFLIQILPLNFIRSTERQRSKLAYIWCYRLANAGWVKSVARGVCDRPRAAFVLALWLADNEQVYVVVLWRTHTIFETLAF